MQKLTLLLAIVFISFGFTKDKPAYLIYNKDGKAVNYSKMFDGIKDADIVFFGELHTDPIAHWLQFELTRDLYDVKKSDLVLGAEMFESDNQLIMDEYLQGIHPTNKFEAEIRLWGNYETDYKPLVEFAKENKLKFVATNIPRRYASLVHKKGFEGLDSLSVEALKLIAPLPINYDPEVKCYKDMMNMGMEMDMKAPDTTAMKMDSTMIESEHHHVMDSSHMTETHEMIMPNDAPVDTTMAMPGPETGMKGPGMPDHVNENFPKAQAMKDATMGYFILKSWEKGKLLFHFNGAYHSDNFEGIVWHLLQENTNLKIATISTVMQEDISKLAEENLGKADFIICVPETMTRTNR